MDNIQVVNEPLTPAEPSQGNQPTVIKEEITPPAPGSKTPSELLLESLKEEREKRRILEEEISLLKSSIPSDEVFSDEGKAILKRIESFEQKFSALEEEKILERTLNQFPALKEMTSDFLEYRKSEHPRAKLESVAKLFLVEKGLLEPQRKGLEKPTGGQRTPEPQGMSSEDIKNLRTTDYRKYVDMLKKGLIKV